MVNKFFKWWYVEGKDYPTLLKEKEANLVAMTRDGRVVQKIAPLSIEDNLVVADLGDMGRFGLTPNQQLSSQTEEIKDFWITGPSHNHTDPFIKQVIVQFESGKVCSFTDEQIELFGKTSKINSTIARRRVNTIVPIGENRYIVWDGHRCSFVSNRETDDTVIKIYLDRIL